MLFFVFTRLDRILATGASLGALAVASYDGWYSARAMEPPLPFYVFVAPLGLFLPLIAATFLWSELRFRSLFVAVILYGVSFGVMSTCADAGRSKVLGFCQQLLASPELAGPHEDELRSLSRVVGAECRILDVEWGGWWQVAVYSRESRVGSFMIQTKDGKEFRTGSSPSIRTESD